MDKALRFTRADVRRAWWATVALFLIHGLVVATWVSRIPAIKSSLHMSDGVLGATLLWSAVGAMVSIPITGWLLPRFGPKPITAISTLLFCGSLIPLALAPNAVSLGAALFWYGAVAAMMDVSMNAHGVEVEKALGTPTMSRFHGMFSLGAMIGAALGGTVATRGLAPFPHFGISAAVYAAAALGVYPLLLRAGPRSLQHEHRLPLRKMPPVLFAISGIGFCMLLSEGAMADWTAVYLKQAMHAGPGLAAAGYSVFSATMATFRFLGDWVTAKLGAGRTVLAGTLLGASGMVWAIAAHSPAWAVPGFGIVGAGFSVVIPLVFGSGGRIEGINPGSGIATVTGLGYIGFIVGPPSIGFLAELITLRWALGLVVVCCLISSRLSLSLRRLSRGGTAGTLEAERVV